MTADEYRAWFAEEYRTPIDQQFEMGMVPERCDCEHWAGGKRPGCTGWVMVQDRTEHECRLTH